MEEPAVNVPISLFLFTPICLLIVGLPALIWMLRKY
jgi:hypothetical protein